MELDSSFLLSIFASALSERSALYCSAPITSGNALLRWVRSNPKASSDVDHAIANFPDEHRQNVVLPNLERAHAVVKRLRVSAKLPIIDPTAVPHIPAWRQEDWLAFWESVIERFAFALVLLNDWQFSYGCAHEFAFASKLGLPAFTEEGTALAIEDGEVLIQQAIDDIHALGGSASRLEKALRLLAAAERTSTAHASTLMVFLSSHRANAL